MSPTAGLCCNSTLILLLGITIQ
nr:unnamed protein product [Callosobruchus analis]